MYFGIQWALGDKLRCPRPGEPANFPTFPRVSKAAPILSPILGLATGFTVRLTAAGHFGSFVSIATTASRKQWRRASRLLHTRF